MKKLLLLSALIAFSAHAVKPLPAGHALAKSNVSVFNCHVIFSDEPKKASEVMFTKTIVNKRRGQPFTVGIGKDRDQYYVFAQKDTMYGLYAVVRSHSEALVKLVELQDGMYPVSDCP